MANARGDLYQVLVNHEWQYSLWPAHRRVPPGWRYAGMRGAQDECLAHLEREWTDPRPLSLRSQPSMAAPGPPGAGPGTGSGCLHELISRQAAGTPDAVAVVWRDRRLTYADLDRGSNQLAWRLREIGVGAGTVVGLCVGRGPELVVGLLAILKAGAAYLPMDPAYPPPRLAFMMADSGARVLVTEPGIPVPPGGWGAPVVYLDSSHSAAEADPGGAPPTEVTPDHLAYVIYTSGSTGRPKGVQVAHRSLVTLLAAVGELIPVTAADTLLAVTTVSFDIAVLELCAPLLAGGRVVIADRAEAMDGTALAARLARSQVTIMQATPVTWQLLVDSGWRSAAGLTMLCGGEVLPPRLARRLLAGGGRLWNLYGPTETTVWSSAARVTLPVREISLGEPLANTRIHLLDGNLDPVATGEPGEICIAGAGLAQGYVGRPGATAQRFVADPYADRPGERLYRTGDLACRLPDGTLRYLGRTDDQIKVRGHRVEPREIEHRIDDHPLVRQAAVTVAGRSVAERHLVACLVPASPSVDRARLIREVRAVLEASLPAYMVPSRFIPLDELPRSATGKIDRRSLAALSQRRSDPRTDARSDPPTDPPAERETDPPDGSPATRIGLERELARIFSGILRVTDVGPHDDFFELGGHSLLAARLVLQIKRVFGVELSLAQFFTRATVADLATVVAEQQRTAASGGSGPPAALAAGASAGGGTVPDDPAADVALDASITPAGTPVADLRRPRRILLTGSSGYLGCHLLAELLARTDAEIVCLVRAPDRETATSRQDQALRAYGLEPAGPRVTAIPGDVAQPRLGLPERDFAGLAREIDVIYHCAAEVNLVLPYRALRAANIGGTREVIRLACEGRVKAVHHASTIGVLRGTAVPSPWRETAATAPPPAAPDGYVRSKWAAERILAIAAGRGLPVTVHRPFLAMGHTATGACRTSNFLSILLRGFLDLGAVPDCDVAVNIVPVDFVSRAMVHVCQDEASAGGIYHFVNPAAARLRELYGWLGSYGYQVAAVPYREWCGRLPRLGPDHPVYGVLPLLQARDAERQHSATFNQSFDCANTWRALGGSGISCEPVSERMVHRTLSYLVGIGFLEPPRRQRERLGSAR